MLTHVATSLHCELQNTCDYIYTSISLIHLLCQKMHVNKRNCGYRSNIATQKFMEDTSIYNNYYYCRSSVLHQLVCIILYKIIVITLVQSKHLLVLSKAVQVSYNNLRTFLLQIHKYRIRKNLVVYLISWFLWMIKIHEIFS